MHIAVAGAVCAFLAVRGLQSNSLSPGGAAAAAVVGMATFTAPAPWFTTVLLVFYLSSSKLTKFKASYKKRLDAEYQEGGRRNSVQVFSNGALGALLAIIYTAFVDGGPTCPPPSLSDAWWGSLEAWILLMYLGHYACCCGDTWASELGILYKSSPVLITTLKPVPPGTNGGVSPLGLLASALGGLCVGVTMAVSFYQCSPYPPWAIFPVIGAVTGLFGSLLDSALGATVQISACDSDTNMIISLGHLGPRARVVSGRNILDNNQVNMLSSLVTSCFTAVVSTYCLKGHVMPLDTQVSQLPAFN